MSEIAKANDMTGYDCCAYFIAMFCTQECPLCTLICCKEKCMPCFYTKFCKWAPVPSHSLRC